MTSEALQAWKDSGCKEDDEIFDSVLPFLADDLGIPRSQALHQASDIFNGLGAHMTPSFLTGDKHVSTHCFWSAFDGSHILAKKWYYRIQMGVCFY